MLRDSSPPFGVRWPRRRFAFAPEKIYPQITQIGIRRTPSKPHAPRKINDSESFRFHLCNLWTNSSSSSLAPSLHDNNRSPATHSFSVRNTSPPLLNSAPPLHNPRRSFPRLVALLCNNSSSLPDPGPSFCNLALCCPSLIRGSRPKPSVCGQFAHFARPSHQLAKTFA
jgi:hypothetical protein